MLQLCFYNGIWKNDIRQLFLYNISPRPKSCRRRCFHFRKINNTVFFSNEFFHLCCLGRAGMREVNTCSRMRSTRKEGKGVRGKKRERGRGRGKHASRYGKSGTSFLDEENSFRAVTATQTRIENATKCHIFNACLFLRNAFQMFQIVNCFCL